MLTGDPPHTGSSAQAIIAIVVTDVPRPIHVVRPTVPRSIDDAVACALASVPADRFAAASALVDALRDRRPSVVPNGGSCLTSFRQTRRSALRP